LTTTRATDRESLRYTESPTQYINKRKFLKPIKLEQQSLLDS